MNPRFAVLLGPTASGKTALCERLVGLPVEIINADTVQMCRELRVGSARPPDELLQRIPHHLVGFLALDEEFGCGDFFRAATELILDITSRGRWPVVVGGAPFYIRALLYGLPQIPPIAPEIRAQLSPLSCAQLVRQLRQVDPVSAARIPAHDHQRLVRALEVFQGCGRALSSFPLPQQTRPGLQCKLWGLAWDRSQLYQRIEQRLRQMLADGLAEEWRHLEQLGCHAETAAVKAIGYREFFTAPPDRSLEETTRLIARNTRRLAKRQLTFYRQIPQIHWVLPEDHQSIPTALQQFFTQQSAGSAETNRTSSRK